MNVQTCVLFTREQLEALIECVNMQISRERIKDKRDTRTLHTLVACQIKIVEAYRTRL